MKEVSNQKGFALETLFLNELKAMNSYNQLNGEIYYWRTLDGGEVDFIVIKKGTWNPSNRHKST